GASAGIGRATALALATEDARIVITARRSERLDAIESAVREAGGEAVSVIGDAREEETARRAVAAALDTFGRLDILINNVGIGNYKDLIDTSADEYDDMVGTNLRSTFLFTRHAVPEMMEQGSG